jgi:hypothetical protein
MATAEAIIAKIVNGYPRRVWQVMPGRAEPLSRLPGLQHGGGREAAARHADRRRLGAAAERALRAEGPRPGRFAGGRPQAASQCRTSETEGAGGTSSTPRRIISDADLDYSTEIAALEARSPSGELKVESDGDMVMVSVGRRHLRAALGYFRSAPASPGRPSTTVAVFDPR